MSHVMPFCTARTWVPAIALGLWAGLGWAGWGWAGWGCAHRVALDTTPAGASIRIDEEVVAVTPAEVVVQWSPFHPRVEAELRMKGYRELDVRLTRGLAWAWTTDLLTFHFGRLSGDVPRRSLDLVLVPVHEGAGTWTADDLQE